MVELSFLKTTLCHKSAVARTDGGQLDLVVVLQILTLFNTHICALVALSTGDVDEMSAAFIIFRADNQGARPLLDAGRRCLSPPNGMENGCGVDGETKACS